MKKPIVHPDEPLRIGRRVRKDILPGHGGARPGAGRPATGNKPVTLRLPPDLIEKIRRKAKKAGQTMSEFVAARLAEG